MRLPAFWASSTLARAAIAWRIVRLGKTNPVWTSRGNGFLER